MSGHDSEKPSSDELVPISRLPATALQALYHAVTGKTENLTERLIKSVIIRKHDIDRLVAMVEQQMQHYVLVAGPTTTIQLSFASKQTQQFSSWARFSIQNTSTLDITSELVIKFEFLLQLPDTSSPQRCVINLTLDSKLPLYSNKDSIMLQIPVWFFSSIPTVTISIDFVDYLIAKIFAQVVKDWFDGMQEIEAKLWIRRLVDFTPSWEFIFDRIGLIGLAGFVSTYVLYRGGNLSNLGQGVYLTSVGMVLLALTTITTRYLGSEFRKKSLLFLRTFHDSFNKRRRR
jgi:hypothetical protein